MRDRRPEQLLAYFSDDFDDDDVSAMGDLAVELAATGEWTVAPPAFVDETDDSSSTQPDDEPIRTVGAVLPLTYDGGPTAPVRDLTAFVDALVAFSVAREVPFELELDGTFVGEIRDGAPDALIRDGLLATWEGGDAGTAPAQEATAHQLVLQWPASVMTYDDVVAVEEFLSENLDHGDIDGHDAGQGEVNIFIHTDNPQRTFVAVKELLGDREAWDGLRIAHRPIDGDAYTVVWPQGLTKFEVL